MAAGTGGHVFPALSLAQAFTEQGFTVSWLGTKSGIEVKLVAKAGYPFYPLFVRGLRKKRLLKRVVAYLGMLHSFIQSIYVIAKTNPQLVVGMGGYVSGPGGVAAKLMGRRLVIHEQNAIPGLTNRLLAKISNLTLYAFPGTFAESKKTACVGNPVRVEIASIGAPAERYSARTGPLRILVFGGSLGAKVFNDIVPLSLQQLNFDVEVWHQTGVSGISDTRERYGNAFPAARIDAFIDNMAEAYAWADVVISRAGALTISELMAAGLASLLIPYPYTADDHQTQNATLLVNQGGAILMPQADFSVESLTACLASLQNRARLRKMAICAYNCRQKNATQKAVELCLS